MRLWGLAFAAASLAIGLPSSFAGSSAATFSMPCLSASQVDEVVRATSPDKISMAVYPKCEFVYREVTARVGTFLNDFAKNYSRGFPSNDQSIDIKTCDIQTASALPGSDTSKSPINKVICDPFPSLFNAKAEKDKNILDLSCTEGCPTSKIELSTKGGRSITYNMKDPNACRERAYFLGSYTKVLSYVWGNEILKPFKAELSAGKAPTLPMVAACQKMALPGENGKDENGKTDGDKKDLNAVQTSIQTKTTELANELRGNNAFAACDLVFALAQKIAQDTDKKLDDPSAAALSGFSEVLAACSKKTDANRMSQTEINTVVKRANAKSLQIAALVEELKALFAQATACVAFYRADTYFAQVLGDPAKQQALYNEVHDETTKRCAEFGTDREIAKKGLDTVNKNLQECYDKNLYETISDALKKNYRYFDSSELNTSSIERRPSIEQDRDSFLVPFDDQLPLILAGFPPLSAFILLMTLGGMLGSGCGGGKCMKASDIINKPECKTEQKIAADQCIPYGPMFPLSPSCCKASGELIDKPRPDECRKNPTQPGNLEVKYLMQSAICMTRKAVDTAATIDTYNPPPPAGTSLAPNPNAGGTPGSDGSTSPTIFSTGGTDTDSGSSANPKGNAKSFAARAGGAAFAGKSKDLGLGDLGPNSAGGAFDLSGLTAGNGSGSGNKLSGTVSGSNGGGSSLGGSDTSTGAASSGQTAGRSRSSDDVEDSGSSGSGSRGGGFDGGSGGGFDLGGGAPSAGGQPGSLDFGRQKGDVSTWATGTEDPADYFSRHSSSNSIFKIVSDRYRLQALSTGLQNAKRSLSGATGEALNSSGVTPAQPSSGTKDEKLAR